MVSGVGGLGVVKVRRLVDLEAFLHVESNQYNGRFHADSTRSQIVFGTLVAPEFGKIIYRLYLKQEVCFRVINSIIQLYGEFEIVLGNNSRFLGNATELCTYTHIEILNLW